MIAAQAAASPPSPPPPWERGFVISDWLVVCALIEAERYSSCSMQRSEGPLEISVHVHEGPTRFKLRRNCLARGTAYLEREGEIGAEGLVAGVRRAVANIAAENCRTGEGKPPRMPDLPDSFYESMNLIFLLMKSF